MSNEPISRERLVSMLEELRTLATQYRDISTRMNLLTQHRQKVQYTLNAASIQITQILSALSEKDRKGFETEFNNLRKALSEGVVVNYHYQY